MIRYDILINYNISIDLFNYETSLVQKHTMYLCQNRRDRSASRN